MALNKPLTLSIVIPAYNEENYLRDCLDSIADQSIAPNEVIVVDNNSTDATAQICKDYDFVKLLTEKRQGIVFARNCGFDQVSSDVIARIDADTVLPRSWVKDAKCLASRLKSEDALTGPCTFRTKVPPILAFGVHRVVYFWSSRLLFGHQILFGSNMFFFRANWLKIRSKVCLTNAVHEDMDLAHHIASAGGHIYFEPSFQASISNRRFHHWSKYPAMWLSSRLIHLGRAKNR